MADIQLKKPGRVERTHDQSRNPGPVEKPNDQLKKPGRIEKTHDQSRKPGPVEKPNDQSKKPGHVALHIGIIDHPSPETDHVVNCGRVTHDSTAAQCYKDYSKRGHWLRAAVLGAIEAVVHISSILMGVDAVNTDPKTIFIAGFAALIAGTFGVAIVEFVTMYTLLDIERAQRQREKGATLKDLLIRDTERLPNPWQAGIVAGLAFGVGGVIPLAASTYIGSAKLRIPVLIAVSVAALVLLGLMGARLGRSPYLRSCLRVLIGGLMVMGITLGITKLVGAKALH